MSLSQKFISFMSGFFMILFGVLVLVWQRYNISNSNDSNAYVAILWILETALIISGIQQLVYYFTMARNMVGGIYIFYKGILLLDAGLFAVALCEVPEQYGMLYLIATMAFSGITAIIHAIEAKRMQSGRWIHQMFYGSVEFLSAIVCLIFLNNGEIFEIVYSVGLFHAGAHRILAAFRPSSIVYIK